MKSSVHSAITTPDRRPAWARWFVLLIASLMLHAIAIEWAGGQIDMPSWSPPAPAPVTVAINLQQTALPAPAVQPKPAPKPKPKPQRIRPRPAPVAPPAEAAPPATAAVAEPIPVAGMETPGTSTEPVAEAPSAPAEAPAADPSPPNPANAVAATPEQATTPPESSPPKYKIDPPPSAQLDYDVRRVSSEGRPAFGHGTITWQSAGSNYTITGTAGALFLTVLAFKSEGMIDEYGVAPVLYSEKRFRKSETNTHFQRERNLISFSASTASYPRKGGEQDRASVVWQLAGIGRGEPDRFAPGAEIDIVVAAIQDVETWRINVVGKEMISVGAGKFEAWHVTRLPRPGSYDKKTDIWLAPQQEWYPVKILFTETNGEYLEMQLSGFRTDAPH